MINLTVVVDNEARRSDLISEHGLSLWLEINGRALLYDTGKGEALLPNLDKLGLNPLHLEGVILSHGHYDHSGGLAELLRLRLKQGQKTKVWCHPAIFDSHLKEEEDGLRDVGVPLKNAAAYADLGAEFHWVNGQVRPWPGATLLAPISRRTSFEGSWPGLVARHEKEIIPDPFNDDLALLLETEAGPVVVTGCAHAGVINILLAAEDILGQPPVFLLGGTHLGPAPAPRQEAALAALTERTQLTVAAGHCTGEDMASRLASVLGPRFQGLGAGRVFSFE